MAWASPPIEQSHVWLPPQGSEYIVKLCAASIGPLSPTLAWGSGRNVQVAHDLCLVAVGLYAIILQRVCPTWLEDNIRSEAARCGGDVRKQEILFQTVAITLSILNFTCIAMVLLACRATRSHAITQLVMHTCIDKLKSAAAVGVLRRSYITSASVLALIVFIFTCIGAMSKLPHAIRFILAWSPAFFPMWVLLQMVTFIRIIAFLSLNEVEAYYVELEATAGPCGKVPDFEWQVGTGHWLQLLRAHQDLVKTLTGISRAISLTILLFQNVLAFSSLLLLWVARGYKACPTSSTMYVILAFVIAWYGTMAMLPLASITDLCQSRRLGRRSLLTLADKYSGWPMSLEVHAEYMRYMQHVSTSPAGIYVPTMGLVTRATLLHKMMFYVKVLPFAMAVTLGWWSRG